MADRAPRVRNVCFTINADGEEPLLLLDPEHPTWQHCKFLVYQREMGSHEHFQGYLELTEAKTYSALHLMEGLERARFAKRFGTARQASHYCMKPVEGCDCAHCREEVEKPTKIEGPWIYGEMSAQGQRADILEVKREIDRGTPLKRIWMDNETFPTMLKFNKGFHEYAREVTEPRSFITRFIIIIGPTRCGKSQLARQMAPDAYWKPPGKWWGGYERHSAVVWDEFKGDYPYRELLRILDSTPLILEIKNADVQFVADLVIFTSNFHPRDWYKLDNIGFGDGQWEDTPLYGRIQEFGTIVNMFPPPEPPQPCPHCANGLCAFHHN